MSIISTALSLDRRSRASGYKITKGFFDVPTTYLPQSIVILGEANTANQTGLTTDKVEVTSANEAATLFGYGSPIHSVMRILRPNGRAGVGSIPTIVMPQLTDTASTATVLEYSVTGDATANATVTLYVNGRSSLDFQNYRINIVKGDTEHIIAEKFAFALNSVLGCPCEALHVDNDVTVNSKWKGVTSSQLNIDIVYSNSFGSTISLTSRTDGTGSVNIDAALSQFGQDWYTIVLNPYGVSFLGQLEDFNGFPSDIPTGLYEPLIMKPFISFFGSTDSSKTALNFITNWPDSKVECTNVLCPAPNSKGFNYEAAANMVYLAAITFNSTPHRDISNFAYPDMPIPLDGNIGDMKDYENRDFLVKRGCSTVILENGSYIVQDLVTTYHPDGETPLVFSYVRDLMIHFNVKDVYSTLERVNLKDKTLVQDNQVVGVSGTIKPKEWKAVIFDMFDDLANLALIKEPEYAKGTLKVQVSPSNPNRFETTYDYKITSIARLESTDVRV